MSIELLDAPFDPYAAISDFRRRTLGSGALSSFVGFVRDESGAVEKLLLECYPGFTDRELDRIDKQVRQRFDLADTMIIHRFGVLLPDDPIVLVCAASAHRKEAIGAVDCLMDYLKTDAPFWKKELGLQEGRWIEPRPQDRLSRANWEN